MKKIILWGLTLLILSSVILTGCSKKEPNQTKSNNEISKEDDNEKESIGIAVDKKLLTVDITLPESIVGDLSDFNEKEYLAENKGINSAKVNEDGTITLNMSKKKHNELMNEVKIGLDETFGDLIEGEDTLYIKKIDYTKNYREVTISVDKEAYESAFDLTPLMVGMTTGIYQVYSGEEYRTTIIMKDVDNDEEIHSVTYPDVFND